MRAVLKPSSFACYAEGHFRRPAFHSKQVHHSAEIRIRYPVKNYESRVNRILFSVPLHINGIGMTAYMITCLKDRYIMIIMQEIRSSQT